MDNVLQIVVIVFAIQGVALFVAMAFGRAAKAGDRFDDLDDAGAFEPAPVPRDAGQLADARRAAGQPLN
jgi:hypothetical protein